MRCSTRSRWGLSLKHIGKDSAENMASLIASLFALFKHHTLLLCAANEMLAGLLAGRFALTYTARAVWCALQHRAAACWCFCISYNKGTNQQSASPLAAHLGGSAGPACGTLI